MEITKEKGFQKWKNGKIARLILSGKNLTKMPESICAIYSDIKEFDISNNSICPPYPACIEMIGYQDTENCTEALSCPEGYVVFDEKCYYYGDLQVLNDFTNENANIESYHPLLLGYQVWKDNRLVQLGLDGWGITAIPKSITKLDQLEYLNLNNNYLDTLPDNLCTVIGSLKSFDVSNNYICPPYPDCFEFIGYQNTENCNLSDISSKPDSLENITDNRDLIRSVMELTDISSEYFQYDQAVLQSIIDNNESLAGKSPLEIGRQEWSNMRLVSLDLSSLGLTYIPAKFCSIYSNLSSFDMSHNDICPPYPQCIEYISTQNTEICGASFCPDNYT